MKAFISYQENGKTIEGMFELVEQADNYVTIQTGSNEIILPYHKINKIKMRRKK